MALWQGVSYYVCHELQIRGAVDLGYHYSVDVWRFELRMMSDMASFSSLRPAYHFCQVIKRIATVYRVDTNSLLSYVRHTIS